MKAAGRASLPLRGWWWPASPLVCRSPLTPSVCLRRLRDALVVPEGSHPRFNGRVGDDRFELQRWWGWFSPTRWALAGEVHAEGTGARLAVWVRPGVLAQMGAVVAVLCLLTFVLALLREGPFASLRTPVVLVGAAVLGLAAFALSAWRDPLGEGGENAFCGEVLSLLEASPEEGEAPVART